jgi:hypothetical protein
MPDITPQFGTAEYADVPETDRCQICQQLIGPSYYRVNQRMACVACGDKVKRGMPVESGSSYLKALLFGLGAAFLGFVIYSAVGIMTGLEIGYVSLAVGFLVGIAMKKATGGVGGRKYQITAALLTYAAVSLSAIPIAVHYNSIPAGISAGVIVLGLASPFFELAQSPVSGIIGLVILYVGINFAWRQTAGSRLSVDGPYDNAAKSTTATAT